jgi:hypothetical protein
LLLRRRLVAQDVILDPAHTIGVPNEVLEISVREARSPLELLPKRRRGGFVVEDRVR